MSLVLAPNVTIFTFLYALNFLTLHIISLTKIHLLIRCFLTFLSCGTTLESGIDVGQEITVGPGKFVKKNKHRALNKRRA